MVGAAVGGSSNVRAVVSGWMADVSCKQAGIALATNMKPTSARNYLMVNNS